MEVRKETLVVKKKRKANGLTKSIPKLKDIKNSVSSSMFLSTMEMSLSMCGPTSDEDDTDSDFENEYLDPLWVVDEDLMADRQKILASENKKAKRNGATKKKTVVTRKRGSSAPVPKDFTVSALSSLLPPSSLRAVREQQEREQAQERKEQEEEGDPKEPQEEGEPIEHKEQELSEAKKKDEGEKDTTVVLLKEKGVEEKAVTNSKDSELHELQLSGISPRVPSDTPSSPNGNKKKVGGETEEENKKGTADKKGKKKKEKHKSASASLTMTMIRSSPKKGLFSRFGGDDNNLHSGRRIGILPSSLSTGDLTGKQQLVRSPKSSEDLSLTSPSRKINTAVPNIKEAAAAGSPVESKRKRSIPKRLSLGEPYAMTRDDQIPNGMDGSSAPLPSLKALKLLGVKDYDDLFHLDGARLGTLKAEQRQQESASSSQSHRGYMSPRHYSLRHLQLSPRSPAFSSHSSKKKRPLHATTNNTTIHNNNDEENHSPLFNLAASDGTVYARMPSSPRSIPHFSSLGNVSSLLSNLGPNSDDDDSNNSNNKNNNGSGITQHTPESLAKLSNEEKDKAILAMQAQMMEMQAKIKKTEAKLLSKSRKLRRARREAKKLNKPLDNRDPPTLSLSTPTPPVSPTHLNPKDNTPTTNSGDDPT